MKLDILNITGAKTGEAIELPKDVFGIEPNEHAMYLAVKQYLANQRQGTHKTKERNEVRGGGKKPFRQKGTGGARRGTNRSPLMVGGGTIFGPKPHDYIIDIPKKVRKLARKSALSAKAKDGSILIVEDFTFGEIKTRQMATALKALKLDAKKTLLLMTKTDLNVVKSGRNIPKFAIKEARNASTYDLLNNQVLVLQKGAIAEIVKSVA